MVLVVKNPPASAGDLGLIPGWGKSPGRGHATCSSILAWRIPMDREAWWGTVHRVAKSQTRLKRLSTHSCTHARSVKHVLQKRVKLCAHAYPGRWDQLQVLPQVPTREQMVSRPYMMTHGMSAQVALRREGL